MGAAALWMARQHSVCTGAVAAASRIDVAQQFGNMLPLPDEHLWKLSCGHCSAGFVVWLTANGVSCHRMMLSAAGMHPPLIFALDGV